MGQGITGSTKKKPSPETDSDAAENAPGDDSMIDQISGDPYLANLIRKHLLEFLRSLTKPAEKATDE